MELQLRYFYQIAQTKESRMDQLLKIGFSFGRCIRDIVNGKVDLDNVVIIISRTAIETSKELESVIDDYLCRKDYLYGLSRGKCFAVADEILDRNLLFQPRLKGPIIGQ